MRYVAVFITAGSKTEAARIARGLVVKKLAACVNIVRDIRSVYSWKGKLEDSRECLLIAKTTEGLFDKLERSVKRMHSYECPEIIAIPVKAGSREYLEWIGRSVK
ncbi:MAG: divalent-cation tolerance protein CutA [Candidatus Omnitrophica bacterium]|nr:divalent-cation tolerance protein CutA [Candidatus Omnitrophota bacterium]MDD5737351.1 divalent-cation tolerance protein CutA [Candidatus Omnitrophota bacterium]